jgi:hypothetical protein
MVPLDCKCTKVPLYSKCAELGSGVLVARWYKILKSALIHLLYKGTKESNLENWYQDAKFLVRLHINTLVHLHIKTL